MNSPSISAICPVYGGVAWLEQAIACFLKQDYQGPHELLIVNSCPDQTLIGEFKNVRIVNLPHRPASLGELRNICVREAKYDWIVITDSDDIFLPRHLSMFAKYFGDGDWLWLTPQFWILGEDIKAVVAGACPLFSYTKSAWEKVGGYPSLTVGEDAELITKISSQFNGMKVSLPYEDITFGYRWGQGSHHVSGEGKDVPGKASAHDRAAKALQERIAKGIEPRGVVALNPNCPLDWEWKAKQFLQAQKKSNLTEKVAIVQLGRYGDIVNILPIAKHIAERYGKPNMVISRQFAPVLEGVSYVEPFVVDLKNDQINEAIRIAKHQFKIVLVTQIWGTRYEIIKVCSSYNRESWRMAGFEHKFNDPTWRPVFDRRNKEREEALWHKLDNGKPMIVLNVTKSVSSPFPQGGELLASIQEWFKDYNIVDVSDLILPQIYDLMILMERAACLVSIDTALLHFATATNIPVVAVVNPNKWQGTDPRCNWVSRITYDEARTQPLAVRSAITQALKREAKPVRPVVVEVAPPRAIWHCVERHTEKNPKEAKRKQLAQSTWDVLYAEHGVIPCHMWNYPRNALTIGDVRALPYLKDLLAFGMEQAGDEDIIMWTNDDNILHPHLPHALKYHISLFDVCTSQRCEFRTNPLPPLNQSPEMFARGNEGHMGRDLFAATKRWLLRHWDELPDFILGASDFDLALACMVRLSFGIKTTRSNIENSMHPAELPRGYVSHQFHAPKWAQADTIDTAKSQIHNRALFKAWASTRLPDLRFHANNTI